LKSDQVSPGGISHGFRVWATKGLSYLYDLFERETLVAQLNYISLLYLSGTTRQTSNIKVDQTLLQ
jgi:hypothetical protein